MTISFEVNNNRFITMEQKEHDGIIHVKTYNRLNDNENLESEKIISAGDMVMLLNYYSYQKDNNQEIF